MRLSAVAIMALSASANVYAAADDYSKSYSIDGRPEVHVRVDDSSVRITTMDTHQVDFNVKRERGAALLLGGGLKIDSHQDGNRVELTVLHKPGIVVGFSEKRLITEVHMPKEADLTIESRDGYVQVASVNGTVTVHSTDGAIKARSLTGKIELRTVDGAITTNLLEGDVRLHSTDGAITMVQCNGRCDASSIDGALAAEGRFESLNLVTTDGSVVAKVAAGSKMTSAWNLRSVDGSIEVELPQGFQANLNASTQDGHIRLDLPVTVQGEISQSRVRGTLNGGGPELTLKSTDGSIRIGGS